MANKVLIDVTVLAQGIKTGVYRVAHELLRGLLANQSLEVFFTITREQEFLARDFDLREGLRTYCKEHGVEAPFIDARIEPSFTGIDIYLTPFFSVPDRWASDQAVQKVVVAYDLIPIYFPEYCQAGIIDLIKSFYDHLERDWLVFSISECTKRDLLDYRPDIPEENVLVTHLGADERFVPNMTNESDHELLTRYGIPGNASYILSVATLEVRKNLVGVINGFVRYIETSGDRNTLLVLAGMKGWKLEELNEALTQHSQLEGRVVLTGFIDEADLPVLYSRARVFVFMSHYEGFGLPPLEAMSCGIPVIGSNTASLPEVIGDGGIMMPPDDAEQFADAIQRLLSSDAEREGFSRKALTQAASFSWQTFVEKTCNALVHLPESTTPALSIVTICYNEKDMRETCESVRQQSFDNFEWLVIDGGSGPETMAVLEAYRDDMDVFVSEPDNGRYDAMNKGIRRSRGKYLLFLNGGDSLQGPDTLETVFNYSVPFQMMDLFSLKLNAPIVYGEVVAKETGLFPHPMWKTGPQTHDMDFFEGNSLPHQATFIRRDLFERFGLYDDSLQFAADYEWFIRVIGFHGIESQYVPLVVSIYNFEGVSSISIDAEAPHIVEIQKIWSHYSNPDVQNDWPSRDGGNRHTHPAPVANNLQQEQSQAPGLRPDSGMVNAPGASGTNGLDPDFADRLLNLAAKNIATSKLKGLVHSATSPPTKPPANSSGGSSPGGVGPGPDLSHDSLDLLITRLKRAIRVAPIVTDEVPYRRILLSIREEMIDHLQRRWLLHSVDSGDEVQENRYFKFSEDLGLLKASLIEPDEYHHIQQGLRTLARQKYGEAPAGPSQSSGAKP